MATVDQIKSLKYVKVHGKSEKVHTNGIFEIA